MAYDNQDYARWLPDYDYWAMLSSLSPDEMSFFNNRFAQSLTGLPYSCQPLDLWIETTMNLSSKLKQGWLQFLLNEKRLFITTRNANNVARVKTTLNRNHNCQHHHRKHVACQPSRMKKDKQFMICRHAWRILMLNRLTSHLHIVMGWPKIMCNI